MDNVAMSSAEAVVAQHRVKMMSANATPLPA
jgi:hypothetical protein